MSSVRACACVCACICVHACAVEIKPGCCVLCASMMYALGRAYGLPYKMATFHSKKGLFYSDVAVCFNPNHPQPTKLYDLFDSAGPATVHYDGCT